MEGFGGAQGGEGDGGLVGGSVLYGDAVPAGVVGGGCGVVVFALWVELRGVEHGRLGDRAFADDGWLFAIGVINKHYVPYPHIAHHKITRLVITDTIPEGGFVTTQIVNTVRVWFGFHEPVVHI